MRRRERWQNIAWVQWMADDTGEGAVTMPGGAPNPVGASMNTLLTAYKRYVDMERDGDSFIVRVLPKEPWLEPANLAVGLAYHGTNLRVILTTAVVECDLLANGQVAYRIGATEKARWVR